MVTKNKLTKENPNQENKDEQHPHENQTQEQRYTVPDEDWWNSVCYSDYSGESDR